MLSNTRPARVQNAIYWRPATSYTDGIPSGFDGSSRSQSTLPLSLSYARSMRSDHVPTKISPPAVATIPLRVGWYVPVLVIPFAASDGTTPRGTCHLMVPSLRSYAVNCDH